MHYKSYKDAYLYGYKDGMITGMQKGLELAEEWTECYDCPPANTTPMIESVSVVESEA